MHGHVSVGLNRASCLLKHRVKVFATALTKLCGTIHMSDMIDRCMDFFSSNSSFRASLGG
jgi:hypothetical protein